MTVEIDTGRQGAKRQSWTKANPRNILLHLIENNAHETREDQQQILDLLWDQVRNDDECLKVIVCEYWGANNFRAIVNAKLAGDKFAHRAPRDQVEAAKKQVRAKLQVILLDMILPLGKALKECTKADCTQSGGWLAAVANRLDSKQKVGEVLSETDLWAIWRSALKSMKS